MIGTELLFMKKAILFTGQIKIHIHTMLTELLAEINVLHQDGLKLLGNNLSVVLATALTQFVIKLLLGTSTPIIKPI